MKYLIVQDWHSTHGNHSGMVHMCKMLKVRYPDEYEVVIKSTPHEFHWMERRILCRYKKRVKDFYDYKIYPLLYKIICNRLIKKVNKTDKVFLLEYLFPRYSQLEIAKGIKRKDWNIHVAALTHLTPKFLKQFGNPECLAVEWSRHVDVIMTLGSSLSRFYEQCGISSNKISTGIHYVDNYYYKHEGNSIQNDKLTVVAIGQMERNYGLLVQIIKRTPFVHWKICIGKAKVRHLFNGLENIEMYGYISEDKLKQEMNDSDVSLSIMNDTIGSNVITTSLSMGLAQIVSDVGSIRDYCTNEDTIFCDNNIDDFINALMLLDNDRDKLKRMKLAALRRSELFSIEKIHEWFCKV